MVFPSLSEFSTVYYDPYEYERGDEYRPVLNDIVPDSSRRAYDVRTVIGEIADEDSFFELQPNYATNIVTGFGRIGGRSVGFICNQPMIMGGCLDINASDKASRFIQMCDAFGLPLINLVDVPGFLPGTNQQKHQFFGTQLSSQSNSHIHT